MPEVDLEDASGGDADDSGEQDEHGGSHCSSGLVSGARLIRCDSACSFYAVELCGDLAMAPSVVKFRSGGQSHSPEKT
jgi:hypothetical protein